MFNYLLTINSLFFRAECQEQVKGFPGAKFKKFLTNEEAQKFIEEASPGRC